MNLILNVTLFVVACTVIVNANTSKCTPSKCELEKGCVCASKYSPIGTKDTPQFVVLTFDDAMQSLLYENYYKPLLFDRKNPDANPISATFFISHEYSNYSAVNSLYNKGFEIADYSITKNSQTDYWKKADVKTLVDEFEGQRTIISKFANIPRGDIIGARVPNLALAGDTLITAYQKSGLKYDNTWTSLSNQQYFPYTLDYLSSQQCFHTCPEESHNGFWIVPIADLYGNKTECNALLGCNMQGTATEIKIWLKEQFEKHYLEDRAPFTLMINSAWFAITENSWDGLLLFMDYIKTLKDVFVVSNADIIEWMKNPVSVQNYKRTVPKRNAECLEYLCPLEKGNEGIRYMASCVECPDTYPWLGNHEGK